MAKQLNSTDQYGENYPSSYWRVVQVNLCKADKTGMILFQGYPDISRAGKQVLTGLGTDAGSLFQLSVGLATYINSITPNTLPVTAPYAITINSDGTVTVGALVTTSLEKIVKK